MEDITLTQSEGVLVPKPGVKKGLWRPEEDLLLIKYVEAHGEGNWATVSQRSGLMRGGKSCRLRWKNYLRPDIKRGDMSKDEEDLIIRMHKLLGNRWSLIAGRLPGRTDNEVKNYWNTHLNKGAGSRGKRKIPGGDDSVNGRSKRHRRGFSYSQAGGADKSSSTSSEGGSDIGRKELIEEYSRNYIPMMEEDTKSFFTHDMEMESSMLPSVEDTTAFFCYAEPFSYPFSLFETLGEIEW